MLKRFHFAAHFKDIPVHTSGQNWKPVSSRKDLEDRLETRNQYCDFEARLTAEAAFAYLRFYAYGTKLPFFPKPQHVVCLGGFGLINHVGVKMFISDAGAKLLGEEESCQNNVSSSSPSSSSPFAVFLGHYSTLNPSGVAVSPGAESLGSKESHSKSMG